MKIIWLEPTEEHMENIYKMYSGKNERAAIEIYNDILDEVEILMNFPEIAVVEPLLTDYPRLYRSLIVRNTFKVVYFIEEKTIYIAVVFDCRQNPEKLRTEVNKLH